MRCQKVSGVSCVCLVCMRAWVSQSNCFLNLQVTHHELLRIEFRFDVPSHALLLSLVLTPSVCVTFSIEYFQNVLIKMSGIGKLIPINVTFFPVSLSHHFRHQMTPHEHKRTSAVSAKHPPLNDSTASFEWHLCCCVIVAARTGCATMFFFLLW